MKEGVRQFRQGLIHEHFHYSLYCVVSRLAVGMGVFHVASGLIHLLLIVAVISLILHFVRGARGPA